MNEATGMIFLLIIILFYIPLILMILKRAKYKIARKNFFKAVLSIFDRVTDNNDAIDQIMIIHKKLAEKFAHISTSYKSAAHFIEDLFYRVESYDSDHFKKLYGIKFENEHKNRMIAIISEMKTRQPFSSVSSKYANLLNMLKTAFDNNNIALGINNLKQLADDIEILENTIESQSKRNQISIIISVVGVILTIFFGAITLIQSVVM